MSDDHDHDRDRDRANDPANDNGGEHERPGSKPIAPAPARGALASIAALATAFANVPTAAYIGRTGLPMLLFKSRENGGTWTIGQKRMIPEADSRWAVNPFTFEWGYISFGDNKKVVGEEMVSVTKPKPEFAKLSDTGFPWQEQWSVRMKCLNGADAGLQVIHKANTDGTRKAIVLLFDQIHQQLDSEMQAGKTVHDGKIVAVTLLEKDGYQHPKHGPIAIPVLDAIEFITLDGPASKPAPTEPTPPAGPAPGSATADQPRRRRVA
jgi:hypothetical protein